MKTNRIIGATLALLLLASVRTFGVVDQAIQVQGTNLVLSLPSTGNEYYMIQYWPNLQPGIGCPKLIYTTTYDDELTALNWNHVKEN